MKLPPYMLMFGMNQLIRLNVVAFKELDDCHQILECEFSSFLFLDW